MSNTEEIDLIDMFWEWIFHWKSLVLMVIMGVIFGIIVSVFDSSWTEKEKTNMMRDDVSIGDEITISSSEKTEVDELAKIYKGIIENKKAYYESEQLSSERKNEMLFYITQTSYYLNRLVNELSDDQKKYYSDLIGENAAEGLGADLDANADLFSNPKGLLVFPVAMVLLHILINCLIYLFNGKLKLNETTTSMKEVEFVNKCIDWESVEKKHGLSRLLVNLRLSKEKRLKISEAEKLNANVISQMLNEENAKKLILICADMTEEGNRFSASLKEVKCNLEICMVNSIAYAIEGIEKAETADVAVILAKTNKSMVCHVNEEIRICQKVGLPVVSVIKYISF